MDRARARRVRAAVTDAGRRARSPVELERAVASYLAPVVPYDLWCGLTLDPATGLATGGYHDEGIPPERIPRLVELESGPPADFLNLRELSRCSRAVWTLGEATGGDLAASARFREVFAPSGVRHEVRMMCRDATGAWGALILMRGDGSDFSNPELSLLTSLSGRIAEGLRRCALVEQAATAPPPGPGLVLLSISDRLVIDHATEAAQRWLADIDDGTAEGHTTLDRGLRPSGSRAHRGGRGVPLAHPHPSRALDDLARREARAQHSQRVILIPSHPAEVAALLADVYRLTAREREIVALTIRGHSTTEIAQALWLSPYTVQDHLKSVFGKVGVSSRSELTAKLYFGRHPAPG